MFDRVAYFKHQSQSTLLVTDEHHLVKEKHPTRPGGGGGDGWAGNEPEFNVYHIIANNCNELYMRIICSCLSSTFEQGNISSQFISVCARDMNCEVSRSVSVLTVCLTN